MFEKGGFVRYAVSNKSRKSLFRSYKNNNEELFNILVEYFAKTILDISNARIGNKSNYDKFFNRKVKSLYKILLSEKKIYNLKGKEYIFWSYLTKTFNILIYNLVSQIELMNKSSYTILQNLIHVPIDINVIEELNKRIQELKLPKAEKEILFENINLAYFKYDFMKNRLMVINSESKYYLIQNTIRIVQKLREEASIYIEDAYSYK